MKRQIFAAIVLSLALCSLQTVKSETDAKKKAAPPKQKPIVVLTIDYGDGMQKRFPTIPWKEKMTVVDALQWADRHSRGIEFTSRGKGATLLVSKIDDLKNGSEDKKNWVFRVNGKLADRSCGIFPVKRGDRILWKFEEYK